MKLLIILLTTLLLQAETHNFKAVNFYGNNLESVQLVLERDNHTFTIWYKGKQLNPQLMIVSCKSPQGFCLVRKQEQCYGWNEEK